MMLDLLGTLSIELISCDVCLNLPLTSLLSLAATSKALRSLIYTTPDLFNRLHVDELCSPAVPQQYYQTPFKPLLSFLRNKGLLARVSILVLDNHDLPSMFLTGIFLGPEIPF